MRLRESALTITLQTQIEMKKAWLNFKMKANKAKFFWKDFNTLNVYASSK